MSDKKKPDEVTKAGAVELDEKKLDQTSGGVTVSDIHITKPVDKSSPILYQG